jgi:hypothetical protein
MQCSNHPETGAVGACVYCGKLFCSVCIVEVNGKNYCKEDVAKVLAEATATKAAQPQAQQIVLSVPSSPERGARKSAVMALSIIFGVIGILWAFVGPMVMILVGISQAMNSSVGDVNGAGFAGSSLKVVFSLFSIVAAMVMALVACARKASKVTTIVLGSLVIVMGILSTWLLQYVSGPVFTLCGILLLADGTKKMQVVG